MDGLAGDVRLYFREQFAQRLVHEAGLDCSPQHVTCFEQASVTRKEGSAASQQVDVEPHCESFAERLLRLLLTS